MAPPGTFLTPLPIVPPFASRGALTAPFSGFGVLTPAAASAGARPVILDPAALEAAQIIGFGEFPVLTHSQRVMHSSGRGLVDFTRMRQLVTTFAAHIARARAATHGTEIAAAFDDAWALLSSFNFLAQEGGEIERAIAAEHYAQLIEAMVEKGHTLAARAVSDELLALYPMSDAALRMRYAGSPVASMLGGGIEAFALPAEEDVASGPGDVELRMGDGGSIGLERVEASVGDDARSAYAFRITDAAGGTIGEATFSMARMSGGMGRVDVILTNARADVWDLTQALADHFGVGIDDVHVSIAVASAASGDSSVFVIPAEDSAQISSDGSVSRAGRPVVMPMLAMAGQRGRGPDADLEALAETVIANPALATTADIHVLYQALLDAARSGPTYPSFFYDAIMHVSLLHPNAEVRAFARGRFMEAIALLGENFLPVIVRGRYAPPSPIDSDILWAYLDEHFRFSASQRGRYDLNSLVAVSLILGSEPELGRSRLLAHPNPWIRTETIMVLKVLKSSLSSDELWAGQRDLIERDLASPNNVIRWYALQELLYFAGVRKIQAADQWLREIHNRHEDFEMRLWAGILLKPLDNIKQTPPGGKGSN